MKAVVADGGIGGLAAAVALHRRGIDVIVLERAGQPDTAGAALSCPADSAPEACRTSKSAVGSVAK